LIGLHGRAEDERISLKKSMSDASPPFKRTVAAPAASLALAVATANRVLSVDLGPDEEVEWITTYMAGGMGGVSGYTITKRQRPSEMLL
jgi:hypothetical protein